MNYVREFDDLYDVAYANLFYDALTMEAEGTIYCDGDNEDVCLACWKLAGEFVESFKKALEKDENEAGFFDMLSGFSYRRLTEIWGPKKKYTAKLTYVVTTTHHVEAKNEHEARLLVRNKFLKADELCNIETDIHDGVITEIKEDESNE